MASWPETRCALPPGHPRFYLLLTFIMQACPTGKVHSGKLTPREQEVFDGLSQTFSIRLAILL